MSVPYKLFSQNAFLFNQPYGCKDHSAFSEPIGSGEERHTKNSMIKSFLYCYESTCNFDFSKFIVMKVNNWNSGVLVQIWQLLVCSHWACVFFLYKFSTFQVMRMSYISCQLCPRRTFGFWTNSYMLCEKLLWASMCSHLLNKGKWHKL